ncbi:ATP-dependent DNA helicase [Mycobacterium sp.]|uniref:ATP-dependent helicase n=1 Tax=Mycobacterium sp. TaxID=1785 RepID=UPI00127E859F|nr:ATP-dependent DNA helicase [Mycobacterium sp.]KAA8958924.1 MAG: ATP-dependent helicase [Mycobacterium sp.]
MVFDPGLRGRLRILGGPGTGKSTLLANAAAKRIAAGVDPGSVLLLTPGRVGTRARTAFTRQLLGSRVGQGLVPAIREPLVRTVHSYAFAVLRLAAQRAGDPPPRLVPSAEQDQIIAELLAGDIADGRAAGTAWPVQLRPALRTAGFVTELRDLLARCAERGIGPQELQQLGRACGRPEWVAAGRFARQYEQVMLLRAAVGTAAPQATTPEVGAAELIGAALEALAVDPGLVAAQHARIRVLLVDDAQQLDPQAARLVRVLAAGAELTLISGDPGQAVFGFRGAEPAVLLGDGAPAVALTRSYRCAPEIARAVSGIAARVPGGSPICGNPAITGSLTMRLAASAHAEAAVIADAVRRAHLIDGLPWSQMAVIVRSVPRIAAGLSQALARAGVPVVSPDPGGPLAEQPAARALLTVLATVVHGLDGERALALLTGPIGRMDPVSLRGLCRTLRRRADARDQPLGDTDLLVAALSGDRSAGNASAGLVMAGLPPAQACPLRRVRTVLDAAVRCHRAGRDPRETLWAVWQRSGLQRRWLAAWERGGPAGAQAGRDLDAVTALFDAAHTYASNTGGASLRGLIEHVGTVQLATDGPEPAESPEAVRVLSAHAALGHEWDLVVIAGLQEGLWPNTVPRGGVLGTQRLLDVLDGVDDNASLRAPLLADERRLLVAAMGRARRRLLVTAVDGESGDGSSETAVVSPSVFFAEIARWATESAPGLEPIAAPRVLSPAAVVGQLRAVVCAAPGTVSEAARAGAATQLARLARAGVPGADPAEWYGMTPVSTMAPLYSGADHTVTLTPSSLQTLADCPLRWLAENHGGANPRDLRATTGSVLHALIAEPAASESTMLAALDRLWEQLPFDSPWFAANELARHRAMLQTFLQWRAQTRSELTEVGVEVEVDGALRVRGGGAAGVRLRGRIDRLERDAAGRLVVIDVKTGKTPVSKDDAQQHAQLAAYQLAVAEGLLPHGEEPGGARLVYLGRPGSGNATQREQDPLTPAARDEWRSLIRHLAAKTAGPQFIARVNDGCPHCPIRSSCPAHCGVEQTGPA